MDPLQKICDFGKFLSNFQRSSGSQSRLHRFPAYFKALGLLDSTSALPALFDPIFLKDEGFQVDLRFTNA